MTGHQDPGDCDARDEVDRASMPDRGIRRRPDTRPEEGGPHTGELAAPGWLRALSPLAVRLGILLNAGILAMWAFTRFVAFPLLPLLLGFARLPIGFTDLAATTAEVALIILRVTLSSYLPKRKRRGWRVR